MVDLPQPFTVLAPMQEVTDLPFWKTLMQCGGGADLYITEYFRVHIHSTLEKDILASLLQNPTGRPAIAQMIGQDVAEMRRTAAALLEHEEVAGIDINLGCPAPVVCSKQAGGGLLRDLEQVHRLLGGLREQCGERWFTVKTRVGFESEEEFGELLEVFARHEIDMLSVHGRTVRERYQTPVHVDVVRTAVERLACPVVANGNVVDVATGQSYLRQTEAAGLMVGRGAIRNPWIFPQLRAAFSGQEPEPVERRQLLNYILILWEETARARVEFRQGFEEKKHVQKMKRYLNYIIAGLDDDFEFRMKRSREKEELFALLHDFLDNDEHVPALPPERSKLFCGFRELL
ncbi:tRNA dihydrouridine synthase [Roseibacillus persicicus]|uniref:tRNA-dihydrouridine synthase n=1 Tax=Roseibacillus persicicus TaxID=454148 RepID=A0A918TFL6_9BACT|nr:tRNA-dihydrouridine synthase family protein [Roseibacillus persicicus]GHC44217.1 tRNA-dihydrouridine synthase [Roseibacillus persicicus]